MGNYKDALDEYQQLMQADDSGMDKDTLTINIAICMFYLGNITFSWWKLPGFPYENCELKKRSDCGCVNHRARLIY